MGHWKLWPRSLILRPEVYRTDGSNVCKQWCDQIIALNSFRSAFLQISSTEKTVLVKPNFLALQNTALILLISSAVIIPENAGRAYRKRATTMLKKTLARLLMSNPCLCNCMYVTKERIIHEWRRDVVWANWPEGELSCGDYVTYSLHYVNHGGVALIAIAGVAVAKINSAPSAKTFKYLCCRIISKGASIVLTTIYRPGFENPSPVFFKDFTSCLEFLVTFLVPVTITGDINIHLERDADPDAIKLRNLLESFDMIQFVSELTHQLGRTLGCHHCWCRQ